MYKRVEDFIDINDMSRKWYAIPGYNGYELSTDGIVRSMKLFRKYPYGILIKPDKSGKYTISNSNNQRTTLSIPEMLQLINSDEYSKAYPRYTTDLYHNSRNQSCTVVREPKHIDKEMHSPKFTIIN